MCCLLAIVMAVFAFSAKARKFVSDNVQRAKNLVTGKRCPSTGKLLCECGRKAVK